MGWAFGRDKNGRDIGYGVDAKCDEPNCPTVIDRGLAYRCGDIHADDGCGQFFCEMHLFMGMEHMKCGKCIAEEPEEEE